MAIQGELVDKERAKVRGEVSVSIKRHHIA